MPELQLAPTVDILAAVAQIKAAGGWQGCSVGFAAESRQLLENARHKLEDKKMDLIVANDISASDAGFAVDTNRVSLLYPDGRVEDLPLMSKEEVAHIVLKRVVSILSTKSPG